MHCLQRAPKCFNNGWRRFLKETQMLLFYWTDMSLAPWLTKLVKNRYTNIAVRAFLAALMAAVVYILLNSYWVTFFVSKGYLLILLGRIPFNLIEVPIFTAIITVTCIALDRLPPTLLPNTTQKAEQQGSTKQ